LTFQHRVFAGPQTPVNSNRERPRVLAHFSTISRDAAWFDGFPSF
jgi:hypothetical protein